MTQVLKDAGAELPRHPHWLGERIPFWPRPNLAEVGLFIFIWTIIGANLGLLWGMSTLFLRGPTWNDDELDDFPKVDGLMALKKENAAQGTADALLF